jgi:hypothetical protein
VPLEQITVSFSELDSFRQCPLKHQLGYKERWTKPLEENDRRSTGTMWHTVMENHYQVIKNHQDHPTHGYTPAEILRYCRKTILPLLQDPTGGQTDQQKLVEWMYDGYVAQYGIDEQWRILGTEVNLDMPLRTDRGRVSRYHIKGKLDLVVRDQDSGGLWVIDHKSGANLPSQMDLEIDDQFGVYTWMMRERGNKVMGSIHNAARTTRNMADHPEYVGKNKAQSLDQRMSRTYLNRSNAELTNLALDAYHAAVNAYPPKSKTLPLYSSPDSRQCGWKCDFKEAHLAMRYGRDSTEVMQEFGFVQDFTRH